MSLTPCTQFFALLLSLHKLKYLGGDEAEWSKVLISGEKTNANQKLPGSHPGPGKLKKTI